MTPRRWLVLSVRSPSQEDRAGLLGEGLLALGGRALWEEGGWLVTHVPEPADVEAFLAQARVMLATVSGDPAVELDSSWQPHEEWAETWKRGLAPRRVTPRLVVTPSWETPEIRPGDLVITLDPGMAFGNAEHGTTRGCLRLLDACVMKGDRVLDVGSGSGVLAIACALLGASEVIAIEGDPDACETAKENLDRNGVSDRVSIEERWADDASLAALRVFRGVVANIEGATLHRLLPGLSGCVAPGGWMILSGILPPEVDGLAQAAAERGLSAEAWDADGEWRSLLLRRSEERRLLRRRRSA